MAKGKPKLTARAKKDKDKARKREIRKREPFKKKSTLKVKV